MSFLVRTKHEPILSVEFVVLLSSLLLSLYLFYRPVKVSVDLNGKTVSEPNFFQEYGLILTLALDFVSLAAYFVYW